MASTTRTFNATSIAGLILVALGSVLLVAGAISFVSKETAPQSEVPSEQVDIPVMPRASQREGLQPLGDSSSTDDGELHDARSTNAGYSFVEERYELNDVEQLNAYDADVRCEFNVSYPQLVGAGEHTEAINNLLRSTARDTVERFYESPSKDDVAWVRRIVAGSGTTDSEDEYDLLAPEGADLLLSSDVDYAISYNNDRFVSVCFSDTYYLGNFSFGRVVLRTVNVDLQTGERYTLDDVLRVDDALAHAFVDNLVRHGGIDKNEDGLLSDDECLTVRIGTREALVDALKGSGELAEEGRVDTVLFVDGDGRPNLGANYWVSSGAGIVRGWWDVTIEDEMVEELRIDSPFWDLL